MCSLTFYYQDKFNNKKLQIQHNKQAVLELLCIGILFYICNKAHAMKLFPEDNANLAVH